MSATLKTCSFFIFELFNPLQSKKFHRQVIFVLMAAVYKYLVILMVSGCCICSIMAQQNPSNLPSLLNDKNTNTGDDLESALRQKMFVKVSTNKNEAFVGESIMAVYKFYVAMHLNDQPSVTKQPQFSGCSVKELNFDLGPEIERINNEPFFVYTIRKVQLTPLQKGPLSLGQAFVNNFVQIENPDDPFVTKKYNIVVSNQNENIEVKELPGRNKPQNFYGITGTFSITASVANNKLPVGETGHLIVTIKGAGNFDAINKPSVSWPSNTEHFDGSDSQHIDQNGFPVSGDRVFDIPFIGKKEGKVIIPPIYFSFFNTDLNNYQTIQTDSISINFTKALAKNKEFQNVVTYDISNRHYLWIVPVIGLIVALVGFISYKRRGLKTKAALPAPQIPEPPVFAQSQPVYQIRYRTDFSRSLEDLKNTPEHKLFFTKAKSLLSKAVAERIDVNENSEDVLITALKQRLYNAPVCKKVEKLYEAINLQLYAPYETQADINDYYAGIKEIIEVLQSEA